MWLQGREVASLVIDRRAWQGSPKTNNTDNFGLAKALWCVAWSAPKLPELPLQVVRQVELFKQTRVRARAQLAVLHMQFFKLDEGSSQLQAAVACWSGVPQATENNWDPVSQPPSTMLGAVIPAYPPPSGLDIPGGCPSNLGCVSPWFGHVHRAMCSS